MFGVTATMIGQHFAGLSLDPIAASLATWQRQAEARVASVLRGIGYDAPTVDAAGTAAGLGNEDEIYVLCQAIVVHLVAANVAGAVTQQDPEAAQRHERLALDGLSLLESRPEAVSDTWDQHDQTGSWASSERFTRRRPWSSSKAWKFGKKW